MLNKWRKPLQLSSKSPIFSSLSSLMVSKLSNSVVAGHEPTTAADSASDSSDPVHEILSAIRFLGFRRFVRGYYFKGLVLKLNCAQVDRIIWNLSAENADTAMDFFNLLKNDFGFQHSRASRIAVLHVLASKRRFKELHFFLGQMVQEEGKALDQLFGSVSCSRIASTAGIQVIWCGMRWLLRIQDLKWFMMPFLFW